MKTGKLNVEFGAAGHVIPGWVGHDEEVPIGRLYQPNDREYRLPYGDNTVDAIRAEHVFEHVSPADGLRFLDECHRILVPGGTLRMCVPVLDRVTETAHGRDLILNHGHQAAYSAMVLMKMLVWAGFEKVMLTGLDATDGHWKLNRKVAIRDELETSRIEATK